MFIRFCQLKFNKMRATNHFLKEHNIGLQIMLVAIAVVFLCFNIARPLVDYDEATYAKVVVDTLRSGDLWTFTLSGHGWFEKPPMYFWLAMGSIKLFGVHEFAFRLPSIIASIFCLWLVFLIIKELTQDPVAPIVAFLVLLFSPPFFVFLSEMRMDSGVILGILAALLFFLKGWPKNKFLFWVFPAIAFGFMFKSVIVFLIFPIVLIYSFFYKQWVWLSSKYLWRGFLLSAILLAPWHVAQTLRFGWSFWNDYFVYQVFHRSVSTLTGTNNYYDYIRILWLYYSPWLWLLMMLLVLFLGLALSKKWRSKIPWRQLAAPSLTALLILASFTLLKTHLSTYILPAFPFLAMFIALSFCYFSSVLRRYAHLLFFAILILVVVGVFQSFAAISIVTQPYVGEEKEIGGIYKSNVIDQKIPLYSLDWPSLETLSYYGDTSLEYLNPIAVSGKELKAPFYLTTNVLAATYFLNNQGIPVGMYDHLRVLYVGRFLVLIYSDKDLQMPVFSHQ